MLLIIFFNNESEILLEMILWYISFWKLSSIYYCIIFSNFKDSILEAKNIRRLFKIELWTNEVYVIMEKKIIEIETKKKALKIKSSYFLFSYLFWIKQKYKYINILCIPYDCNVAFIIIKKSWKS